MLKLAEHQYIQRKSGDVHTERLYGDWLLNTLYRAAWERAPRLYSLLTSARFSRLLGLFCYDSPLGFRLLGNQRFLRACQVDLTECLDPPERLDTARKIFERKIRYWECRPLPDDPEAIGSPADARVLVGSLRDTAQLFLKGKFFAVEELLDSNKTAWVKAFAGGEFAIFRLTPDKYHYNHAPVAGVVRDFYEIPGDYHPCNPGLAVSIAFLHAKNKRVVTIVDTDVEGGSRVGLVAMVEVVALMIGDIVQCYSEKRYDHPRRMTRGLFLHKGQPKSLYRPGSSTTVLLFQKDRVRFADDLLRNLGRSDARSRFSQGLGRPLVETEVQARSSIATPSQPASSEGFKHIYTPLAAMLPQRLRARFL